MFSLSSCLQRPFHTLSTCLLWAGCVLMLALTLPVWDVCGCARTHSRGAWAQHQEHPFDTRGKAQGRSGKACFGPTAWWQPKNAGGLGKAMRWNPGSPYGTFAYHQSLDEKCECDSPTSFSPEGKKILASLWQLMGSKSPAGFRQFAKGS